jgi:hypothetical protein
MIVLAINAATFEAQITTILSAAWIKNKYSEYGNFAATALIQHKNSDNYELLQQRLDHHFVV